MATLAEKLAQAIATYNKNVSNKESSTIINRSKAAVDAAQKAYDNQPAAPTGPNDAQNRARLEAEAKAAADKKAAEEAASRKARAELDPDVIAARNLQTTAAAEVAATQKSIAEAKANLVTIKETNAGNTLIKKEQDAAFAAAKEEQDAKDAASAALLADQKNKTAATAAALAEAQEKLRISQEETAAANLKVAESAALAATTAAELTAAQNAIAAANAVITSTTAASAESVAAAQANINQSGDVALPSMSIADTASEMYKKELAIKEANDAALAKRQSVMEVVNERFASYNLGTLATKIRELAIGGANEATITLALQQTDEYKKRFKANDTRMEKGLRVLSPSEYLTAEDSYRQVLRTYGLTQFDNDEYVSQFVANDTSATEINNRISTAVTRIQNADPQITKTLKDFYGLGDADLVAYVLDTKNQLPEVMKKVTAAEIGTAAMKQGLAGNVLTSEALAAQGIDQAQAQATYSKIAEVLPTAEKLSEIYGSTLEGYDQTKAEKEYFGQMASAKRARESLRAREIATFSGSSGLTKGSLTQKAQGQIQIPISIDQPEIAYKTGSKSQPIPPNRICGLRLNEQKGGQLL